MSHYTLMIHLSDSTLNKHARRVEDALSEALAPFEESPPDGSPYGEFEDMEPEYREKWENEKIEQIRLADGSLHFTWDDQFNDKSTGFLGAQKRNYPPGSEKVEVSFKEIYASFDEFTKEYAGYKRDPKTGKIGRYHNPNAKWDWYQIGGRWRGFFPVKGGTEKVVGEAGTFDNPAKDGSDVVSFEEIDLDACARTEREKFAEFVSEYRAYLGGQQFDAFDGPRSTMFALGLMRVEKAPYVAKPGEILRPWSEQKGFRDEPNIDVILDLSDEALTPCAPFFSPLRTYAVLDAKGEWHAAGDMGWFGCGSDTPEKNLGFAATFFERFIKPAAGDGLLVCVDCHI